MLALIERLNRWRGLALAIAVLGLGASGTAPAHAAGPPAWKVTMTHANPYGAQSEECPSKKPEVNGPEGPCGINPLTEPAVGQPVFVSARDLPVRAGCYAEYIAVPGTRRTPPAARF